MSWISLLNKTYDNLINADNEDIKGLIPICHSTQKAHIEVVIDKNGDFINANFVVDVNNKLTNLSETLIPITESSASRSSGSSPHPLCDKLKYIALDYKEYYNYDNTLYYTEYISQLQKWAQSEYSNDKVISIYLYLKKGTLIKDLVENGILSLDENGKLTDKWEKCSYKLSAGNQAEAFVRFRVITDNVVSAVWQDKKLQTDYINYYLSTKKTTDFCYITGNNEYCSVNHPSKIEHSGSKAKLISSNDTNGLTYLGRFTSAVQAVSIGYMASQKAHNALKYLISNQGVKIGGKTFVIWGTKDEEVPPVIGDSCDFFANDTNEDLSLLSDTKEYSAKKFGNAMRGYKSNIKLDTELAVIGFDAATTGRLSIVYYHEYFGEIGFELLNNVEKWHETCGWYHRYKFIDKKLVPFYGAPSPCDIATCAYGTEQNGFIKGTDKKNKIVANAVERILFSIVDGAKVPVDIVNLLVKKCYSPQNYNINNWHKVLSITCSMYKKYLYDYNKGEIIEMAVQNDSKNIDYNCGRLLAVADAIESYALKLADKEKGGDIRTTSAMIYFSKFSSNPCETWEVIKEKLVIYEIKLGKKGEHLFKLLGEISDNLNVEKFGEAKNLDGRMALGFDSQRKAIIDNSIKIAADKKSKENN